ncbi:hypothetical protein Tco_0456194, partial [Tanacetum coccineum]
KPAVIFEVQKECHIRSLKKRNPQAWNSEIQASGQEGPIPASISLFSNLTELTKHIDIRYHWIRDAIEDGMFELNKVHMDDNAFDMLTKAVAREKLKICCSFAGMANSSS